ncbi:hypothetical protein L6164_020292 [Bauhinia variegata]|uniref:Uncharacterized protein n=1 Tax=Bauhinia variegata TaxID=167791 RepID=A0ACB9MVZ0_BAUVA|nr:hypothetical protein L6164_020292 [Bauhinia variegata]
MERVAPLENRVLQLSLDMEMGNTSRSSSSTSAAAEKLGHESEGKGKNEDMNVITPTQNKPDPLTTQDDGVVAEACSLNSRTCRAGKSRRRRKQKSTLSYTKWLTWTQFGCGC